MSLLGSRQQKLDPILDDLIRSPGVVSLCQDDFDSASVNVFLTLGGTKPTWGGPRDFDFPIRTTKAAIKRIFRKAAVRFNFLHWPQKKYVADGSGGKMPDGYDCDYIKIEIFL